MNDQKRKEILRMWETAVVGVDERSAPPQPRSGQTYYSARVETKGGQRYLSLRQPLPSQPRNYQVPSRPQRHVEPIIPTTIPQPPPPPDPLDPIRKDEEATRELYRQTGVQVNQTASIYQQHGRVIFVKFTPLKQPDPYVPLVKGATNRIYLKAIRRYARAVIRLELAKTSQFMFMFWAENRRLQRAGKQLINAVGGVGLTQAERAFFTNIVLNKMSDPTHL